MNIEDANQFLRAQMESGAAAAAALQNLSARIESDVDAFRSQCPELFPLSHSRRQDSLYRLVALVQEIDTNLSLFQFRTDSPFAQSTGDTTIEYLDATNYFLVPLPGALPSTLVDDTINTTGETRGRGVKRTSDDQPVHSHTEAAFEVVEPDAANRNSSGLRSLLNLPHAPACASLLTACIATTITETQQLRLNDVVEVFGFLRTDDMTEQDDEDSGEAWGWNAHELPQGLVARMTIVHVRRPELATHVVPPLPPLTTRALAVAALSKLCFGDMLAAEYILLALVASVVRRHDDIPIGDVPLYLQLPEMTSASFADAAQCLRQLSPVACVDLSLKEDGHRLTPRMDHQRNILLSGALQVAPGTAILVDPRGVAVNDELNERLVELIHRQAMKVDYVYSSARVLASNHIIITSDVAPSAHPLPALNVSCFVKVLPSPPADVVPCAHFADIRAYIQQARHQLEHLNNEDDGLAARMANEMVDAAQKYPTRFNRDPLIHNNTFSALAAMTRARAASFGRSSPSYDDFTSIMALEADRCDRIS